MRCSEKVSIFESDKIFYQSKVIGNKKGTNTTTYIESKNQITKNGNIVRRPQKIRNGPIKAILD